jgi:hypothetical protein
MPEPSTAAAAATPPSERPNVFLDGAAAVAGREDPVDDLGGLWAAATPATSTGTGAGRARQGGHRVVRRWQSSEYPLRRHVRRFAAAAAFAVAALTLLGLAFRPAEEHPAGNGESARPGAAAPAATERLDARLRHGARQTASGRPVPTSRSDRRSATAPRAAARRSARRRVQKPTRLGSGLPALPPAPAQSAAPAPSPPAQPRPPRARVLPAPVPTDAPPEFM